MPAHVVTWFLKQGIMQKDESFFYIPCDTTLELNFTIHGHVYTFDLSKLIKGIGDQCAFDVQTADNIRYTTAPSWHFGSHFLNQFCHVYNYEDNSWGLANYKEEEAQ